MVYRGSAHPLFGVVPKVTNKAVNFTWSSALNCMMRSEWEVLLADLLVFWRIKAEYEPEAFPLIIEGKETTYTPDFHLTAYKFFIEVKGLKRPKAMAKIDAMPAQYPDVRILLIDGKEYAKIAKPVGGPGYLLKLIEEFAASDAARGPVKQPERVTA